MKMQFAWLLLLGCAAVVTPCPAQAPASTPANPEERTLMEKAKAIPEARQKKDVDFLNTTLTDDFTWIGSEGHLHNRRELLESAKEGELQYHYAYNLRVIPVDNDASIVTYDCVVQMPEGDAPNMAPRYQRISDVWVRQGDDWRLKFQQASAAHPVD